MAGRPSGRARPQGGGRHLLSPASEARRARRVRAGAPARRGLLRPRGHLGSREPAAAHAAGGPGLRGRGGRARHRDRRPRGGLRRPRADRLRARVVDLPRVRPRPGGGARRRLGQVEERGPAGRVGQAVPGPAALRGHAPQGAGGRSRPHARHAGAARCPDHRRALAGALRRHRARDPSRSPGRPHSREPEPAVYGPVLRRRRAAPGGGCARRLPGRGPRPGAPVVATCGSGVSAAVLALAMYRLGRRDAAVYDGSWTEWGGRSDTPVAS